MHIDTAGNDPKLPPLPVVMRPVGRFMLPVPEGMEASAA